MASWSRAEIEAAFVKFQQAARDAGQSGDWRAWADCFTEDAHYVEHHLGNFSGREQIYHWVSQTMAQYPNSDMVEFPVTWYSIDVDKGWVFCEIMNRMKDLGDGQCYQAPNMTILHYAGNGLFNYEEDIYNPANLQHMIRAYLKAKAAA